MSSSNEPRQEPIVRITLTENFEKLAEEALSEHEQDGLYRTLANSPLAGSESPNTPGLMELDWRGDGSVIIAYLINKELDEVILISIYSSDDEPPDDEERTKLNDLISFLKRFGFGYSVRELIEILKDNWPF